MDSLGHRLSFISTQLGQLKSKVIFKKSEQLTDKLLKDICSIEGARLLISLFSTQLYGLNLGLADLNKALVLKDREL